MKKWIVSLLVGMLVSWIGTPAQAGIRPVREQLPVITAEMQGETSSLAIQTVNFSGDEVVVKTTISNPENVFGYGFVINYDPTEYEFVGRKGNAGMVLANEYRGPGHIGIASVTLTDSRGMKESVITELDLVFRKKTKDWGELKPSDLEIHTLDRQSRVTQSLPAFVPAPRPQEFKLLLDNYPNPFNPATTIKYATPSDGVVKLTIYNVVGQVVRTLVNNHQRAGEYAVMWNATNDTGQPVADGLYFYRITTPSGDLIRKMLLLK